MIPFIQDKNGVGKEYLYAILVFQVLAFLLYAESFSFQWTYDDFPVVLNNQDIRSIKNMFIDQYPGRFVREISLYLDFQLFGDRPSGYHFQNIFWHALNGAMVYVFARRLNRKKAVASIASLLFLVHPIQVEVVANISHRKDSLCLFFMFLAFFAYQKFLRDKSLVFGIACLICTIVSCGAKQNGILIPLLLGAYEYSFIDKGERFLLKYPKVLWGTGSLVVSAALYRFFILGGLDSYRKSMLGLMHLKANWEGDVTFGEYALMTIKSWALIVSKVFFPNDLALEYTYSVPESLFDSWVLATSICVVGIFIMLCSLRRHSAYFWLCLLWFVVLWTPVANLWPLTYFAADRYLYIPSVPLFLAVGGVIDGVFFRRVALQWMVVAVVVLVLSALTLQQGRVWRSPETLWTHALSVSPESTFALNNVGMLAVRSGDLLTARKWLEKATRNRYNPNPFDNLGWVYEQLGERDKAQESYLHFILLTQNSSKDELRSRADFLKKWLAKTYGVDVEKKLLNARIDKSIAQ